MRSTKNTRERILEEAIKLFTLNSARQLKVDQYVGSIEPGKEADFVIWNGDPLSVYAQVLQTWIEGRKYFDKEEDKKLREEVHMERAALIQKALEEKKSNGDKKDKKPRRSKKPKEINDYQCTDVFDFMGENE